MSGEGWGTTPDLSQKNKGGLGKKLGELDFRMMTIWVDEGKGIIALL